MLVEVLIMGAYSSSGWEVWASYMVAVNPLWVGIDDARSFGDGVKKREMKKKNFDPRLWSLGARTHFCKNEPWKTLCSTLCWIKYNPVYRFP